MNCCRQDTNYSLVQIKKKIFATSCLASRCSGEWGFLGKVWTITPPTPPSPCNSFLFLCSGDQLVYNCGRVFERACLPDSFTLYSDSIGSQLWLHWVHGVSMFSCNLPSALLAEWRWPFLCNCSNKGVGTDTEYMSAHKVNSGEENSPADAVTKY